MLRGTRSTLYMFALKSRSSEIESKFDGWSQWSGLFSWWLVGRIPYFPFCTFQISSSSQTSWAVCGPSDPSSPGHRHKTHHHHFPSNHFISGI